MLLARLPKTTVIFTALLLCVVLLSPLNSTQPSFARQSRDCPTPSTEVIPLTLSNTATNGTYLSATELDIPLLTYLNSGGATANLQAVLESSIVTDADDLNMEQGYFDRYVDEPALICSF